MAAPRCGCGGGTPTATAVLPNALDRFRVFDTLVHGVDKASALRVLDSLIEDGQPHQVVTVNVDFLRIAERLPRLQDVINTSDLAVPDGVPLVWMARYLGMKNCRRITGPDLIEAIAQLSVERDKRIYLLGGARGAATGARERLQARFPGLNVCGVHEPMEAEYPFPPEMDEDICRRIRDAKPDVLFVAFGCPKQDLWIRDHMQSLGVPISIGVGGSFNFLSGRIPRAPKAMQRLGLEWVYRLGREPHRLWRRYLLADLPFAVRLIVAETVARLTLRRRPLSLQRSES